MNRTITALYDSRADAETAREQVRTLGLVGQIVDDASRGQPAPGESRGIWESIRDFFTGEDAATYDEGLRRGHYLLTVNADDENADRVIELLDRTNAVDVDTRSAEWRDSGWTGGAAASPTGGAMAMDRSGDRAPMTSAGMTGDRDRLGTEERIPVVEEQLVVGKREINRGGVRVRSYVREIPVHEDVRLREEHVDVERRPVTGAANADLGGDAFRERTIEVSETAEEAVVGKQARVVEEVVIRKGVEERVEQIDDTVRRTEVDIERGGDRIGGDAYRDDRLAAGGTGPGYAAGERPLTDMDGDGRGAGSEARGLGNEAVGNAKQGLGNLTGSESLRRDGEMQERRGEAQQGKPDERF